MLTHQAICCCSGSQLARQPSGNRSSAHLHRQVPQVFVVQLKRVCAHVHRLPGLELLLQRLYDGKDVARCTAGDACAVFGVRVY